MEILICALIGYLIGCFNPAYLIGKIKGVNVKENGSGNAGASNALILFGKITGVVCAVLDIAKPCLAIWLGGLLLPNSEYTFAVAGVATIMGHMFPFYMKFRGGKGLASLGGLILFFDWRVFLIFLLAEIVVVLLVDYICVVPITASIAFPIVYYVMTHDLVSTLIILIATVCMILKHIENLRRIKNGTELHFSFIWKKDQEMERLENNIHKIDSQS